jgi:hypothetical protein
MGDFNRYMDKITADERLKEKTKQAVAERLATIQTAKGRAADGRSRIGPSADEVRRNIRPMSFARRIVLPVAAAAATFAVLFSGYLLYRMPVSYVSMDINPGIELTLNVFNRVIHVEATNEDGKGILNLARILNRKADKAAGALLQLAYDQRYVDENGSTVISVLVQSEDPARALQLAAKTAEGIQEALGRNKAYAAILVERSGLEIREAAAEARMSAGRYRLVRMLQAMDPTITIEQYRNARISEIIQKADGLADDGNRLEGLDEATRAMVIRAQETADDVIANQIKAARQKQEQNGNQNQSGGPQNSDDPWQNSSDGSHEGSDPNQGNSSGTSHQSGSSGEGTGSGSGVSPSSGGAASEPSRTDGESGQGVSGDGQASGANQSGGGSGHVSSPETSQPATSSSQGTSSASSQTGNGSDHGASSGPSSSTGNQSQGGLSPAR